MTTFKNVTGQILSFSLREYGDVILHPGQARELPAENAHIRALAGKGLLIRMSTGDTVTAGKSKTKVKSQKPKK